MFSTGIKRAFGAVLQKKKIIEICVVFFVYNLKKGLWMQCMFRVGSSGL
jgi:hypothetical protein